MHIPGLRVATGTTPAGRRAAVEPPILFIHVPKTAGTSMRHSLEATLGSTRVYPSDHDIGRRADGCYPTAAEILKNYASIRPYRVLIGHFPAGLKDELPVPHRTAVILRDPVQRVLSLLAHLDRCSGIAPATALADSHLRSRIEDRQTKFMAARVDEPPDVAGNLMLERALDNLDAFDFVGLTERHADSCRLFDSCFGTAVSGCPRQSNVLRPGGRGLEEFIPLVEPLVARDRVLYEQAKARFEQDLAAASPAAGTLRRAA